MKRSRRPELLESRKNRRRRSKLRNNDMKPEDTIILLCFFTALIPLATAIREWPRLTWIWRYNYAWLIGVHVFLGVLALVYKLQ